MTRVGIADRGARFRAAMDARPELSALEAFDEGVVAIDATSRIVFFNPSAERMFGYSADEVLGQPLEMLIPENARAAHRGHVDAFRRDERISSKMRARGGIRARRRNGDVFEAEASLAKSRIDGREVVLAVVRDVTERNRAEARLRAAEQRQRAILDTCGDAILLIDSATGLVIDANGRARGLFGCDRGDIIGVHQDELRVPGGRQVFAEGPQADPGGGLAGGAEFHPDATARCRDGTTVPVEITRSVTEIDGRPTVVEYIRDVSYRRAKERELVEAREQARLANESKTRFLANMSHELRTPLNAIIGMSEMIRDGFWGPLGHAKYGEYATDINDSGRHLLDLINDILDLSRIELDKVTLHYEAIDLAELVEQCRRTIQSLLDEHGLSWEQRVIGSKTLVGDRRAIRQMLLNLLSNAIKHTPASGRISVTIGPALDGGVSLTVADSGLGIPQERLTAIMEPFNLDDDITVSRQGGTGLGLAITKRLIEAHGGQLLVDSAVGEGTSVHLVFPERRVDRNAAE